MKKFLTLLFAAGLVTAASAQSGYRHGNDSRNNNTYQSSPYSSNDRGYFNPYNQYSDRDQYSRNSEWNDHDRHDRYDRDRRWEERQRYEMMMRRRQAQYYNERRYNSRAYRVRVPVLGLLSEILR